MDNEFRIFGPPGTGKTTWLVKEVRRAAEKHGGDAVLCCSFTKTAAQEMVSRISPPDGVPLIPERSIGTLHSLCYRALDTPTIAETKVDEWNASYPNMKISKTSSTKMDDGFDMAGTEDVGGDALLATYSLLRNRLTPFDAMPEQVQAFAKLWEGWKQDCDFYDFTDLLIQGRERMLYPPNGATIAFVDEAQDLTPLQMLVVRQWSKSLFRYILVGDDDQCIFRFSGASPEHLIADDIPSENRMILKKSYRVPVAVHKVAIQWIERIKDRVQKEYLPSQDEGQVSRLRGTNIRSVDAAIEEAKVRLDCGLSVMFLASCSYLLRGNLIPELKAHGIPFHNPYRLTQGEWNPLRKSKEELLRAFLEPEGPKAGSYRLWNLKQLAKWTESCRVDGLLKRGGRAAIKALGSAKDVSDADILDLYSDYFVPEGLDAAIGLKCGWLFEQFKPEKSKSMEYVLSLYAKGGMQRITERPRCVVGTIHSVKGGEADAVFLFPDLSPLAYDMAKSGTEGRDAVIRQYYVGMTRARHELIICDPGTRYSVSSI